MFLTATAPFAQASGREPRKAKRSCITTCWRTPTIPARTRWTRAGAPHILVETQGAAPRSIPLEQTAPGHYEARIPADQGGLYRIVSGSSELVLPEAGFYRESEETKPQAVNTALLGEISRVTGGRMHPSIEQLLNDKGALCGRGNLVAVLADPRSVAQFPGSGAAQGILRAARVVAAPTPVEQASACWLWARQGLTPTVEACATRLALPRNPARMAGKKAVNETNLVAEK